MTYLKYVLLIMTIILSSCSNDYESLSNAVVSYDIYVVGFKELNSGVTTAMYWKNGVAKELVPGSTSEATAVVVQNKDVYISGSVENKACYWKNGIITYLPEGDQAKDIKVILSDVYVAGSNNLVACYWKNDVKFALKDATNNSMANKIIIEGADVYVAGGQTAGGYAYDFEGVYWKNDTKNTVIANGMINAISIKGSDVYVAGYQITTGINNTLFWNNNVALTYPIASNEVIRVAELKVFDNNVYTLGAVNFDRKSTSFLWKNNAVTTLFNASGTSSISANDFTIVDGKTFVCGTESINAKIWINDKETILSDGTNRQVAKSIFVVKK